MPNRIQALNTYDFTGGLNTRKSSFQLAPNEVPEILNMEIDPRGGVYTRKGWERWSTDEVVASGVDPYILLDGSGKHVTVPDEAALELTGDMQVVVGVNIADWAPSAQRTLLVKGTYVLYLQTDGKLKFNARTGGGNRIFTSSVSMSGVATPNANWWVGCSFDVNNGAGDSATRFWQSSTGPNGPWTELGTVQTVTNTGATDVSTAVLSIGSEPTGASPVIGRLLHAELRSAIGAANTMSTVSVVFELDTSTDLAGLDASDMTITTASAHTATLTGSGMLVNSAAWNPRNAYLHENSSGTQYVLVANGTTLWSASTGGTFTSITNSDLAASPHLASFAPWGDNVYVAQGRGKQGLRTTGTGVGTLLTASAAGAWQNDPTVHTGTHMPKAEHVAAHNGYLFVANVNYDAANHPNRIHWSHPGYPESWDQTDLITINEGGSKITGLVPFGGHLLIFKTDSVWALYGSAADTWQLEKVTGDIGAPSTQAIAVATQSLYFFGGDGIYRYSKGALDEVSYPIRNIFPDIPVTAYSNIWLGWVDRRLWASLPYDPDNAIPPTEPVALFVFDPIIGERGAWTRFEAAARHPIAPFVDHTSSADAPQLAFDRIVPYAIELNATTAATDDLYGTAVGFDSYIRTAWLDAGAPTLRKSWRRPDFVFRNLELDAEFTIAVDSFNDFNPEATKRSAHVELETIGGTGRWGDGGLWGDSLWNTSDAGLESQIKRGPTFGLARAIALRLSAPTGIRWGLNAIVSKFVPRRLR